MIDLALLAFVTYMQALILQSATIRIQPEFKILYICWSTYTGLGLGGGLGVIPHTSLLCLVLIEDVVVGTILLTLGSDLEAEE